MKLLSHLWLFSTPRTVAYQAPLSMGFSRQKYWSGLPFPSPGDLPNPGIKSRSPTLQADALTSEPPEKGNAKECSNYCTIALISHTSKVMLKFSKPGFSSMWIMNFQIFKLDLEKAEEPEIKLPNLKDNWKKKREFQKNIYFCFIDYAKAFYWVDHNKLWKFFQRWEYKTTLPASWEICI